MNLKLDGISTSEHIDSSGELLIIENHDISDLVEGKGVLNFEHSNKAEDIVGAVIYAKKIMKKEDCENDRQRKYWEFSKKPFVYIIGELWEDEEHPGACAVAAMVRYYNKKSEKILVGFSIEGATLERDDYILKESVGRRVAITLRSCNKMAIAGVLDDPREKSVAKSIKKMEHSLAKSFGIESCILEDMFMPKDPILDLHKAVESLAKTMEAGMYNVAPSQLTGQAALTREHISGFQRNRVKAAVRDWDRKRPLKEVLKGALPEVSDDYIGHFEKLAEELALKKNMPSTKLVRIGQRHSPNQGASEDQKKLVEGLYFDYNKKPKSGAPDFDPGHEQYTNRITEHKNDAGQAVLVKPNDKYGIPKSAENATHYHELARDFFGMGNHVPVTNYFKHPHHEGEEGHHQAMEIIPHAETPLSMDPMRLDEMLDRHEANGTLDKLMIMDHILGGHTDRHMGNSVIDKKGNIHQIDNDRAFTYESAPVPWFTEHHGESPIHPDAAKWVNSLDPKSLVGKMMDQGHSPDTIKNAAATLRAYQKIADRPTSKTHAFDTVNAHVLADRLERQKKAGKVA